MPLRWAVDEITGDGFGMTVGEGGVAQPAGVGDVVNIARGGKIGGVGNVDIFAAGGAVADGDQVKPAGDESGVTAG